MWLEYLPADCDLIGLDVRVGGVHAMPCYIGPPEADGLQQLNVLLREVDEPEFSVWRSFGMAIRSATCSRAR